jgi:hypothetical protein
MSFLKTIPVKFKYFNPDFDPLVICMTRAMVAVVAVAAAISAPFLTLPQLPNPVKPPSNSNNIHALQIGWHFRPKNSHISPKALWCHFPGAELHSRVDSSESHDVSNALCLQGREELENKGFRWRCQLFIRGSELKGLQVSRLRIKGSGLGVNVLLLLKPVVGPNFGARIWRNNVSSCECKNSM